MCFTQADSIAVIQDGVILEMGSHDQLLAAKGAYYSLISQHETI